MCCSITTAESSLYFLYYEAFVCFSVINLSPLNRFLLCDQRTTTQTSLNGICPEKLYCFGLTIKYRYFNNCFFSIDNVSSYVSLAWDHSCVLYDIRGISRCLHKCHLLLGNLPNLCQKETLVLLKEKSSNTFIPLYGLSISKNKIICPFVEILAMKVAKPPTSKSAVLSSGLFLSP